MRSMTDKSWKSALSKFPRRDPKTPGPGLGVVLLDLLTPWFHGSTLRCELPIERFRDGLREPPAGLELIEFELLESDDVWGMPKYGQSWLYFQDSRL